MVVWFAEERDRLSFLISRETERVRAWTREWVRSSLHLRSRTQTHFAQRLTPHVLSRGQSCPLLTRQYLRLSFVLGKKALSRLWLQSMVWCLRSFDCLVLESFCIVRETRQVGLTEHRRETLLWCGHRLVNTRCLWVWTDRMLKLFSGPVCRTYPSSICRRE
jgi:hypothetical protein